MGQQEGNELNFLKNARGEEIAFEVEKGGGARANLLATRSRRKSKLMDAAATRVGVMNYNNATKNTKKRSNNEDENKTKRKKGKSDKEKTLHGIPEFLIKNIDFSDLNYISDSDNKKNDS